jgi:hypothetical protein
MATVAYDGGGDATPAINFAILTSASGLEVVADQGCCT